MRLSLRCRGHSLVFRETFRNVYLALDGGGFFMTVCKHVNFYFLSKFSMRVALIDLRA